MGTPKIKEPKNLGATDIARAELARRRKKLGFLTLEQELYVENLMLSTASRISERLEKVTNVLADLESRRIAQISASPLPDKSKQERKSSDELAFASQTVF